jgi:hypothetical protein
VFIETLNSFLCCPGKGVKLKKLWKIIKLDVILYFTGISPVPQPAQAFSPHRITAETKELEGF